MDASPLNSEPLVPVVKGCIQELFLDLKILVNCPDKYRKLAIIRDISTAIQT
jgi:hypothetical protein